MGQVESTGTTEATLSVGSPTLTIEDLFSKSATKQFYEEVTNQSINSKLNQPLDSVLLSSLLNNPSFSNKLFTADADSSEIEKLFLAANNQELSLYFDQTKTFSRCYDAFKSFASDILHSNAEKEKDIQSSLKSRFSSSKKRNFAKENFLESFMLIPFDELVDSIDLIEPQTLLKFLKDLNQILQDHPTKHGLDSPTIRLIQKALTKIVSIKQFQIPEIQALIITFLFNSANLNENVCDFIFTLKIIKELPVNELNFNSNVFLFKSKIKSSIQFIYPIEYDLPIPSFSIGSNVLVLLQSKGLAHFAQSGVEIVECQVVNDSILLDTYSEIYIISTSLQKLFSFPKDHIASDSMKTHPMNKILNSKHRVLACGVFQSNKSGKNKTKYNICILQHYNKCYRISIFEDNLNKPKKQAIKFNLNAEDVQPITYYMNKDVLNIIFENHSVRSYKIIEGNKTFTIQPEQQLSYCTSFFDPDTPIFCFKDQLFSLIRTPDSICFVKHQIINKPYLVKAMPFSYTNSILPTTHEKKPDNVFRIITNRLILCVDSALEILLNKPLEITQRQLSFLIDKQNAIFDNAFVYIGDILKNNAMQDKDKISFISLVLKVLAVNLYSFCLAIPQDEEHEINEKYKETFDKIKNTIDLAISTSIIEKSPLIMESICTLLSFSFQYLYYPAYSSFNTFLSKITRSEKLTLYFISNANLLSRCNCIFYIFNEQISNAIEKSFSIEEKQSLLNSSLKKVHAQLEMMKNDELNCNEQEILNYFKFIFKFINANIDHLEQIRGLVQTLLYTMILLEQFPQISQSIVEMSIPIMEKLSNKYISNTEFKNEDKKYSQHEFRYSLLKESKIVESAHNYPNDAAITDIVEFANFKQIHLIFDPKCRTERNYDVLKIIDNVDGSVLYSLSGSDWPKEIDVKTNSLKFHFTSDSSGNYWGYKIRCEALAASLAQDFDPSSTLYFYNLFANILGRLTYNALMSIPQSKEESQCKLILDQGILQGSQKADSRKPKPKLTKDKRTLSRGISRGLSFESVGNSTKYSDDMKKGFVDNLITSNPGDDTFGDRFLKFMYLNIRANHAIKPNESILMTEKFIIAAFMKQLGFLDSAISFAMSLPSVTSEEMQTKSKTKSVPPNLSSTMKAVYKIRAKLYLAYQQDKKRKADSKDDKKPVPLHQDFEAFYNEVITKCKFLLYDEPILKKRYGAAEKYDQITIDKTITELSSFLTSELLMENLSRMADQRTKRMEIRLKALDLFMHMIEITDDFATTILSYLDPLDSALSIITDLSEIKSIPQDMITQLEDRFSILLQLLISKITNFDRNAFSRLLYIKIISVPIKDIINTKLLLPSFNSIISCIEKTKIDQVETYVTFSSLWRLIGLWSIQFTSNEIITLLLKFTKETSFEFNKFNSILLLASLTQESTFDQSFQIQQIIDCFTNATPRIIIASFIWLSKYLAFNTVDVNNLNFKFNNKQNTFKEFLLFALNSIGQTLCGKSCLFIADDSLQDSHLLIAEEIISFFRFLLKPFSKVKLFISDCLHQILEKISMATLNDNLYQLIAIFSIFGKEIISFHSSGYAICHMKGSTDLTRIVSYDPISNHIQLNNSNCVQVPGDKLTTYVPSVRITTDPDDFTMTKQEVQLFEKLSQEILSVMDNFTSIEFSVLSASFIGFLTISLQNQQNMKMFVENADLLAVLNCAQRRIDSNLPVKIPMLIDQINRNVNEISSIQKLQKLEEPKEFYCSLVSDNYSPRMFISALKGKVENYDLISEGNSLFFGDCALPCNCLFYYELKIKKFGNGEIIVGFIDNIGFCPSIQGIALHAGKVISPFIDIRNAKIKVSDGDTIGCGFSNDRIIFTLNGQQMDCSIPYLFIDNYVPAIKTIGCDCVLEFNFGHKPFQLNMDDQTIFDLTNCSYEQFEVIDKSKEVKYSSTNEFDDIDFDNFVLESTPIWETSNNYTNEERYFKSQPSNKSGSFNPNLQFKSLSTIGSPDRYVKGQPVLLSRAILTKEEALDQSFSKLSLSANLHIQKYARIVDVTKNNTDNNLDLLYLEFIDALTNKKEVITVDKRYVDLIDSAPLVKPITYSAIMQGTQNNDVCYTYVQQRKEELYDSTRKLLIKMARILSLIFIDYFRLNKQLSEYFHIEHAITVFKLAMSDVFKFRNAAKQSSKWSDYRVTDFIFTDKPKHSDFDINYLCPCDTHIFARFIRAIIYKESDSLEMIINQIVKNSSNEMAYAPNSSRSDIFNLVSNKYIIETTHPLPTTSMDFNIIFPHDIVGLIPVLHPSSQTDRSHISISKHQIVNPVLDSQIFPRKDFKFRFDSHENNQLYGLKLCLLPIYEYLPDNYSRSQLGSIHVLFILLSIILSAKDKESFQQIKTTLKQIMVPSLTELMNGNNFFVDLLSYNVIAPIFMSIPWDSADITDSINKAFLVLTATYHEALQKWEPLNASMQKVLDMSVFTRLLILNIAEKRAYCDSEEPSKEGEKPLQLLFEKFTHEANNKTDFIFDEMVDSVTTCCALGFDLPIPMNFPSYLIAETWAESFPLSKEISFEGKIENVSAADFRLTKLECVNEIPENCNLRITSKGNSKILAKGSHIQLDDTKFNAELVDSNNVIVNQKITLRLTGYPNTHETKSQAFVQNYKLFREHIAIMSNWDVRMDEALGRIIKQKPSVFTQFPLQIHDPLFVAEEILLRVPTPLIRCRLLLMKRLQQQIPNILKMFEFNNPDSSIAKLLNCCKSSIPFQYKIDIVKQNILKDMSSSDKRKITFNRFASSLYLSRSNHPQAKPILDQFIAQIPISELGDLKREDTPWKVNLMGEGAIDAGGPGRDLFTECCMEVMHPALSLFTINPNKRINYINDNQEQLIPLPQPMTEQIKKRYYYAGVLISLCYISKIPEPFSFARFVWNYLTNRSVTVEDIYTVDNQFKDLMNSFEKCDDMTPQQFETSYIQNFQVTNSLGEVVDLIPGGSNIPVTYERRLEYVQRCKAFRIKEFNEQLSELKKGFNHFFMENAAGMLAPWELELLICGDNQCPVEDLKRCCDYDKSDPFFNMLWEVLEEFTPQERMLFIKFGCGRMGLPPPGMSWTKKLTLETKTINNKPDEQFPLPTAMTCSNKMVIPKFRSKEWMAKKIRAAILFGGDINLDTSSNFHEVDNLF